MVIIGGEGQNDLKDLWVLNLDTEIWEEPVIEWSSHYTAKRFHSASTISDTQVVTFGGCHSEYVHLNELHLFDMKNYLEMGYEHPVTCTEIKVAEGVPSTRWGHASTTYRG
jgi:hypothetical protein